MLSNIKILLITTLALLVFNQCTKKTSEMTTIEGLTAQDVINTYLMKIGGREKLEAVKSISMTMKADLGGREAIMESVKTASGKFMMQMKMMGMVLQETKFDGQKGTQSAMGQTQELEGDDLKGIKKQGVMFDQLLYSQKGYNLELAGIENIDGKMCYKIQINDPDNEKSIEFYDIKTGLLTRSVSSTPQATLSNEYKDYKEIKGIKLPHVVTISGAMPIPIAMEVTSVSIDESLDESIFKID